MMIDSLTAKQSQALALGILVIVLLIMTLGIAWPVMHQYEANQDRIALLNRQLMQYSQNVSERDLVVMQTANVKNAIQDTGIFSREKSMPLLMAELQEDIKRIVATSGGELKSTQNLSQSHQDGLIKLGIQTSFSGKMENIKQILYQLESAKPYLLIQRIKINAAEAHRNLATGKIDSTNVINVLADIVTFTPAEPT